MKAIRIVKEPEYKAEVVQIDEAELPRSEGNIGIDVEYSTINYKDGLAITGSSPVVRSFPMVPGIDLVGKVNDANGSADFQVGDSVLVNGWGLGETAWGGLAQQAWVKPEQLTKVPEAISNERAAAIGTAGYTAMLCVLALERQGLTSGDIVVSGAAGGVGSVAVALLAKLGYTVTASSGRSVDEKGYLQALGATEVIDRTELSEPGRPLGKERWHGAVDVAGSHTLANLCASVRYGGTVAACGLAQGLDLPATVMPFILRGVTLAGVDSVFAPVALRQQAWDRLALDLDLSLLDTMTEKVSLEQTLTVAQEILQGKVRGRVVVDVNA